MGQDQSGNRSIWIGIIDVCTGPGGGGGGYTDRRELTMAMHKGGLGFDYSDRHYSDAQWFSACRIVENYGLGAGQGGPVKCTPPH